jgi:molecular chaperone IbpA
MNAFNLSPLYRTAIGFDRLARLADAASTAADTGYPPYNIEKTADDAYRLSVAVAGFRPEDLDVVVKDNALFVVGRAAEAASRAEVLHRGIAGRAFERRFVLAEHMVVEGASIENGLLHVSLRRVVPESLKPRRIAVTIGAPAPANDGIVNAQAA